MMAAMKEGAKSWNEEYYKIYIKKGNYKTYWQHHINRDINISSMVRFCQL